MSRDEPELPEIEAGNLAQEVGQKNSVEIFLNSFERSIRSARVYAYDSGQNLLANIYDNVVNALERALHEDETIDIHVKPLQLIYDRKVVYENKDKKKSLAFQLHENGVRLVSFKRGMTKDELLRLINLFALDFSQPDMMDQDLYCAIVEQSFDHIEVVGANIADEAQQNNPEIKAKLQEFEKRVKVKTFEKKPATARRLRGDDLKVLEEFHLNPAQFARPDEEVSKIVRNTIATQAAFKREKETLERLALMGFHFLLQEGNPDQAQVGRDLVVQVSMMILDQAYIEMFGALIKKVYQLHKDQPQQRGEYQKILDQIFHVDHYDSFRRALHNKDLQEGLIKILLGGPPSAVKLIVLLLPVIPGSYKIFGDFILSHLPEHTNWLTETVQAHPDLEAWEHLVNVLALKPNPQFSKFLITLVENAGETMKVKVLRQCAVLGTTESLDIFRRLLKSENAERRLLALDMLSHAKNRPALLMLKSWVDSPEFSSFSADEKEIAYRSLIRIAGMASYPWFEGLWFQPGSGLFKSKNQNERRMILAKAALAGNPEFLKKVLEKNASDLNPELKALIERGLRNLEHQESGKASS